MRFIQIFFILIVNAVPVISFGQETVSRSGLLGIDLTLNSKRENRSAILNMYTGRMDSFAIRNNIKVDKTTSELLYTDVDLFFENVKKKGWEVSGMAEPDFYQINKGNNRFIAYVKYDNSPLKVNFVSYDPKKVITPYAIGTLYIIRRR